MIDELEVSPIRAALDEQGGAFANPALPEGAVPGQRKGALPKSS
ncbi:hypothetical protein [Streptomyces sp. LN549]